MMTFVVEELVIIMITSYPNITHKIYAYVY